MAKKKTKSKGSYALIFAAFGVTLAAGWLALTKRLKKSIASGIQIHSDEFDGLYEGIYQSAENSGECSTDAYIEWCDRVEQISDEAFRRSFFTVFSKSDAGDKKLFGKKASVLLDCISKAEIVRIHERGDCCTADEELLKSFVCLDGQKPKLGGFYTVLRPAWINSEETVEYGLLVEGTVGEHSEEE